MSRAYCAPRWHDGGRVPAAFMVMGAARVELPPVAPLTVEAVVDLTWEGPTDRFACCSDHLGRAVEVVTVSYRYVIVRAEQ